MEFHLNEFISGSPTKTGVPHGIRATEVIGSKIQNLHRQIPLLADSIAYL